MPATLGDMAKLRAKFPAESVGKLPRSTCKDCGDRNKECQRHQKSKCPECGNYMGQHMHLDYVGHAEVTDRLLTVDPLWSWEPVAYDERGLPAMSKQGNEWTFWIRLTVLGVTRLGVGSVAPNSFDAEKQLIGDALRNAAMRFGVALDLWAKEELESSLEPSVSTEAPAAVEVAAEGPQDDRGLGVNATQPPTITTHTMHEMQALFSELGVKDQQEKRDYCGLVLNRIVESAGKLTEPEGRDVVKAQRAQIKARKVSA